MQGSIGISSKTFFQIARSLTSLLAKDAPFIFNNECHEAFQILKKALISTPIIQPPDWKLPLRSCVMLATLLLGRSWPDKG
jgi:hypothetical protein